MERTDTFKQSAAWQEPAIHRPFRNIFLYALILYHKEQGKTNVSGREFLWGKKRLRR